MAHFAKLDENNVILEVLVIADRDILDENGYESEQKGDDFLQSLTGTSNWKKTSFNTREGKYYLPDGTLAPQDQQYKAFRGNFATPGAIYDPELDVFFPRKEDHQINWIKDTVNFCWKAPVECPDPERYWWNVEQNQWVLNPDLQ